MMSRCVRFAEISENVFTVGTSHVSHTLDRDYNKKAASAPTSHIP